MAQKRTFLLCVDKTACLTNKDSIAQAKKVNLDQLPIGGTDHKKDTNKHGHDRMVKLVASMLAMHNQLASSKSEAQRAAIQRQINATDRQIDRLVYDLYGLTDEEIKIVEEATGEQ